ncbi:EAL domain-containing protein [Streptomyces sp. NP160]|uniref:GGDEF domain-containing phosphodiesterase n=1 Tax=Streptomyces sp. NP160 TaxID=2586637 RepID=UPI0011195F6B|nr:GGDEF domain-containing phosphodiesterase [Streptomyces sp. NP160]TNM59305.1 EAL domain-containing protein [Streptomyces sp. NP160]
MAGSVLAACAVAAGTAAVALLPQARAVDVLSVVQLAGVAGVLAGLVRNRPARPVVWLVLLGAAVLYGAAWWAVVLDAGAAVVALACTGAFLALGRVVVLVGRQREQDAAVDAVDVALLAIAAASSSLTLVAVLPSGSRGAGLTADAWLAAQAAGVVVVAAAAAWAVVTGRLRSTSVRLLLVVAAGLLVWHLATIAAALGGGYAPGSAADASLVVAWSAFVAAAWHPSMRALGRPVAPSGRRFPATLAVLGAGVTLVVLPGLSRWSAAAEPTPVLLAASAATVALLVLRQWLSARSVRRSGGVDPLTGLGTRRSLLQALAGRLADPASPPALLCVVDLEAFADVNATRGHAAGDLALAGVAQRLAEAAPPGSRTYRTSGDGFAVLAPAEGTADQPGADAATGPGDAAPGGTPNGTPAEAGGTPSSTAQGLLAALSLPFEVPGGQVRLRGRVGEVLLPGRPDDDPDDAAAVAMAATAQLGDAELALAEAVRRRVPALRATPHLLAVRHDERALAARLPAALAGGEVVPHYQPIVTLGATCADDRVSGHEALARWQHPGRGTLGADRLVPLAERLGVVRDVDEAVLRLALLECSRWRSTADPELRVSVNASASTLLRPDLSYAVLDALVRAGLPGTALVLEITEGSWLSDRERIAERLGVLREHGVRVAVDDFGTGYASLDYLVSFPVDSLKVDRSLVRRIEEPACARLLGGVVDIARDLGVLALAEGVDTPEQVELARRLGFGAVQGHAVGVAVPRPLSAEPPLAETAS